MDAVHDDCYVVFVRADRAHDEWPENVERPIAVCPTYGEARRAQRAFHRYFAQETVIRFVGDTGGGD
jgi:hypothetical protein